MDRLTNKRIKTILRKYKKSGDLFNWCEEYKEWAHSGVHYCVTVEWEYILKKSYEDREAPFGYEDLDLFDVDKARECLEYEYEDKEDEFKEYANDKATFNRRVKTKGDFRVFLNSLDKDELREMFEVFRLDDADAHAEVYEWWIVTDPVKYELENQDEIMLNGAWGRQTSGQGYDMDYCMQQGFINRIKRWLK